MLKQLVLLVLASSSVFAEGEVEEFTTGSRLFSGSIYKELIVDNNDNVLVSPFSVETLLALLQSGAQGATGDEIRTSLHLPATKAKTETAYETILPAIQKNLPLQMLTSIYLDEGVSLNKEFETVATDVYQAVFRNAKKEEIEDDADTVNAAQVGGLTVINALSFQSEWEAPFTVKKGSFYVNAEETMETEVIYQESEQYNYAESEELDAQILEIPFLKKDASLTIILPNQKEGIAVLEKQIDATFAVPEFSKESVEVFLPKFRIATKINLDAILQELGVQKAFDAAQADFSGIAGAKGDLHIAQIRQETYMEVNEMGVDGAFTSEIGEVAEKMPIAATKSFLVDHPFLFYVKVNDIIVFEGRVLVP